MTHIRLGACVPTDMILEAEEAGYDYIESDLSKIAVMSKMSFLTQYAVVKESGIRVEVMRDMLPSQLNITGRGVNAQLLHEYFDFAFERARMLGCDTCVLASPAARQVPEGWPLDVAWRQMSNFLRLVSRHASAYSLNVAIEPVCRDECNIMNTLSEAALLCSILKLDRVWVAANVSHMSRQNEDMADISRVGELLKHVHIASRDRRYPTRDDADMCKSVFQTLYSAGYTSRVSVEADYDNFREEAAESFRVLNAARDLS